MEGDRVVRITGDKDSQTSRGYLCPKGVASFELLYHPERVPHPLDFRFVYRRDIRI